MKADLFAVAAASLLPMARAAQAVSVTIESGTIIGSAGDTVDSFRGIPFADPPIDDLRFKPPVKLSRDLGTFDATKLEASCPQGPIASLFGLINHEPTGPATSIIESSAGVTKTRYSEDCLTINVQRPHGTKAGDDLPVLFWIYGGGFVAGSTAGFDAKLLLETGIKLGQPFIFVAVNYRIGAWGFMPGQAILDEGSGNAGLLDQRMGLEWVADNIAAFGGDPDKVTIWGESAGAISVFDQLVLYEGDASYNGKALFRGAIMNSGSATPTDPLNAPKGQAVYDAVVKAAGCEAEDDTLACLRAMDNASFSRAANSVPGIISYQSLALSYLPRPDGTVLADSPDALQREGKFHPVPMIIGTQEDEGTLFSLTQLNMGSTEIIVGYLEKYYFHHADTTQITTFVNTYGASPADGSPYRTNDRFESYPGRKRIAAILGDIVFNLIRRVCLQTFASVSPDVPTWSYFSSYNYNPNISYFGTSHGSDVLVLFSQSDDRYPTLSGRTYYINFVHNLDPNEGAEPDVLWPQWKENKKLLEFQAHNNTLRDDTYRNSSYTFMLNNIGDLRF